MLWGWLVAAMSVIVLEPFGAVVPLVCGHLKATILGSYHP